MSQADTPHSIIAPGLNRRAVIAGAIGTAAAGGALLPVVATAAPRVTPSAEFRELQALVEAQYGLYGERGELIEGESACAPLDTLIDGYETKIGAVIDRINAKPPSVEALIDQAAVFLVCCDGFSPPAFEAPEAVLLTPNDVRRSADSLEIAGGRLAAMAFGLMQRGGANV
jgi:hypothetical protein